MLLIILQIHRRTVKANASTPILFLLSVHMYLSIGRHELAIPWSVKMFRPDEACGGVVASYMEACGGVVASYMEACAWEVAS